MEGGGFVDEWLSRNYLGRTSDRDREGVSTDLEVVSFVCLVFLVRITMAA